MLVVGMQVLDQAEEQPDDSMNCWQLAEAGYLAGHPAGSGSKALLPSQSDDAWSGKHHLSQH